MSYLTQYQWDNACPGDEEEEKVECKLCDEDWVLEECFVVTDAEVYCCPDCYNQLINLK